MSSAIYERIRSNPKFHDLEKRRGRFAWLLSSIVLFFFYGYILMVAFAPATLAQPVSEGSALTLGIAFELSMFVGFWLLVALYVRRANSEFDQLTQEIVKDAVRDEAASETARKVVAGLLLLALPAVTFAGGALDGQTEKQPLNVHAIGMFVAFVVFLGPFGNAVKCRACGLQWDLRRPPTETQLKARASMIAAKRKKLRQPNKQAK